MTKRTGSYWADGLSIIETKFSVLILLLIVAFGIGMYFFVTGEEIGDINQNLLEIIRILIYAIAGVNIADKASDIVTQRKRVEELEERLKRQES